MITSPHLTGLDQRTLAAGYRKCGKAQQEA